MDPNTGKTYINRVNNTPSENTVIHLHHGVYSSERQETRKYFSLNLHTVKILAFHYSNFHFAS